MQCDEYSELQETLRDAVKCHFDEGKTKFILDNGYIATCRTEEDNISMQKVIHALGFTPCE
jgi:hypothetical protein